MRAVLRGHCDRVAGSRSVFVNADGFTKRFPHGIQGQVVTGTDAPLDKCDAAVLNFNACNSCGMDTAACVAVRSFPGADHRAVCMPGDQQAVVFQSPVSQEFFGMFFPGVVFGCAGWVRDSEFFQRPPDITYQKS